MELVIPEHKVLGSTILACAYVAGEIILGLVAWISPSWRIYLRILYGPGIFFIFYIWLTHESVRWLLSKGRNQEAKQILKTVAEVNGTKLSEDVIVKLNKIKETDINEEESIFHIFKSTRLIIRLVICFYCWICSFFIYYGLTLHSVSIYGNMYTNYITVTSIEIPAYFLCNYTSNRLGRRLTSSMSFILGEISCFSFIFVPTGNSIAKLIVFLLGKFFVIISFTFLFMYTTEMFPTNLRHSLLSACTVFGCLGLTMAPQIPLLVKLWDLLPLLLFSIVACSSGLLCLCCLETNKVKLPDTIMEAVALGKTRTAT